MHSHLNAKFANDVRGSPGYRVAGASDRWSTSLDGGSADLRNPGDMEEPCSHVWRKQIHRNMTGLLLRLKEIDGIWLKQREKIALQEVYR